MDLSAISNASACSIPVVFANAAIWVKLPFILFTVTPVSSAILSSLSEASCSKSPNTCENCDFNASASAAASAKFAMPAIEKPIPIAPKSFEAIFFTPLMAFSAAPTLF